MLREGSQSKIGKKKETNMQPVKFFCCLPAYLLSLRKTIEMNIPFCIPKIYPVWLCPFKLPAAPGMLRTCSGKDEMFVDIGTYGVPKVDDFHPVKTTRRVESFVRSVHG